MKKKSTDDSRNPWDGMPDIVCPCLIAAPEEKGDGTRFAVIDHRARLIAWTTNPMAATIFPRTLPAQVAAELIHRKTGCTEFAIVPPPDELAPVNFYRSN